MTKKTTEKSPISLEDGQIVTIDGQEFIFEKGSFRLKLPEESSNDKHFYLHFRDIYAKDLDTNEINGCPIKHEHNRIVLDISPIIEQLFKPEARAKMRELKGITEVGYTESESDGLSLPFSYQTKKKINKSLDTMLDMAIVNQKQRQGFQDYINKIFDEFWSDFWR